MKKQFLFLALFLFLSNWVNAHISPDAINILNVNKKNVNLVIVPDSETEISFTDDTYTYDGMPKSIYVSNLPIDATVVYHNNGQTDAGIYEVTATVSQDNFADLILTANLNINKAQAVITADSPQTFTYDGTLKNIIASLNNSEGSLSYSPQQGYIDVGTYAITVFAAETDNYLVAFGNVNLVIEQASQTGITFADGTFTYDGTPKSISVSNLPIGATVVYQNNAQTDAGSYTVIATVSQDNFDDQTLTAELTIDKAQALITADSPQTFTYDGTVKDVIASLDHSEGSLSYSPQQGYIEVGTYAITVSSAETDNYLEATENVSLVIELASQMGITFADGTFTYDGTPKSIFVSDLPPDAMVSYQNNGQTDAGNYEVTATVSEDNFADLILTADLTIDKAQAVITAASPQTFTYDGTVKDVIASLNNSEGTLSYSPQQGYIEVGTYAITVSSAETNNYLPAIESVTLVIQPASQTGITFADGTFTYDGTPHSIFVSNLPSDATVSYENNGQTDAGTYEVTATVSQDNYADQILTADLTIDKAQAVITAANPQSFTYDGTVKNVSASLNNSEGTLSYSPQQGYIEVGTYAITVSSAETNNYLPAIESVTLVIQPASQTGITFADGTFTYDGTPKSIYVSNLPTDATVVYQNNAHTNAGIYEVTATVSRDNYDDQVLTANLIINKAQPVITADSPQTFTYDGTVKNITASLNNTEGSLSYSPQQGYADVGTYAITVFSAETDNYLVAFENVSLVIEPASQTEITFANGTFTYDGTPKSIYVSNLPTDATVVYQNNAQTNAGTYEVTATVSQDNFTDLILTANLTINKAQAVIIAASQQTFTYDGNIKNVIAILNNSEGSLSYSPQQGYTDVGTYAITVSSAETDNYLATSENVSLVIEPASQTGIAFADGMFVYDGTVHSIFVIGLPTDATVSYQNNGQTDAGTYVVNATVSQDNYEDQVLTANLIINKAQAIITAASPQTFTYDGTVKNITASLNNSEGSLSYSPQQGYTEVGTYAITVFSAETDNYLGASENVSLVIEPASQTEISFEDGTFTYDGTPKSIYVSNLPPEATVDYQNNDQTDAGTYEVTATVSQDDFADLILTADLIINKAEAVITADSPQTYTYDGTIKNVIASLGNNEGSLSYSPQQGYIEVGTYEIIVSSEETDNYLAASENVTLKIVGEDAPVPDIEILPTITGECAVLASDIPIPTATDSNGGQIDGTTSDPLDYFNQGSYTITWNYEDSNGNLSSQTQTIIVEDITAPVPDVAELANIEMECGVTALDIPIPTATDNCVGQITATTNDPLGYSVQGTYTITWEYNDGNGNISSQTQTVIVNPSPLDQVAFDDKTVDYDGNLHIIEVDNLPTDAVVSYSISPNTGTDNGATDVGVYTVTAELTPPVSAVDCEPLILTATLTIEQAQQTISFDPIPIKYLEDDSDFQLMATASSGLPVNYTFTFSGTNPPATVSPDGFVTLLTNGIVEITAHQDGNVNYLPADPVEQTLIIGNRDADLLNININGLDYNNPSTEVYYTISCGASINEVEVSITASDPNATVEPGQQFTIATPKPGIYTQKVTVTSQDSTTVRTYLIHLEKRFVFADIVVQKFDNVLLVNNNPDTNGGYKFKAYKWYKNGEPIGNEQYYSAGETTNDLLDPNAEYYVEMTTLDGDVLRTCIGEIVLNHNYSLELSPNPVPKTTGVLYVDADFPTDDLKNMSYAIYSLSGRTIVKATFDYGSEKIHLPENIASGVYLVRFSSPHFIKTYKVVVQ